MVPGNPGNCFFNIAPPQCRLNNPGLIKCSPVLVDAVDIVADADIQVLVPIDRGVVISFRGDDDPFSIFEAYELGDFFAGGDVPEAGSAIITSGYSLLAIGRKYR